MVLAIQCFERHIKQSYDSKVMNVTKIVKNWASLGLGCVEPCIDRSWLLLRPSPAVAVCRSLLLLFASVASLFASTQTVKFWVFLQFFCDFTKFWILKHHLIIGIHHPLSSYVSTSIIHHLGIIIHLIFHQILIQNPQILILITYRF